MLDLYYFNILPSRIASSMSHSINRLLCYLWIINFIFVTENKRNESSIDIIHLFLAWESYYFGLFSPGIFCLCSQFLTQTSWIPSDSWVTTVSFVLMRLLLVGSWKLQDQDSHQKDQAMMKSLELQPSPLSCEEGNGAEIESIINDAHVMKPP